MATIRVHTTQNVTIEYEVASLGDRIVATLLDYLIRIAWAAAAVGILAAIASGAEGNHHVNYHDTAEVVGTALAILICIILFAPVVFYNLGCELLLNGQTIGKKARDLRVVRLDGTAPRFGDYFLRWLLRIVDLDLPVAGGLVAIITILVNGKGQRLGDMAAGTTVISLKPRPAGLASAARYAEAVPAGYQPVFAQAADLSDHDVALLHQLLSQSLRHGNYVLLNEAATKIKSLLHLQSDLSDEAFLRTILRDHAYLVAQG